MGEKLLCSLTGFEELISKNQFPENNSRLKKLMRAEGLAKRTQLKKLKKTVPLDQFKLIGRGTDVGLGLTCKIDIKADKHIIHYNGIYQNYSFTEPAIDNEYIMHCNGNWFLDAKDVSVTFKKGSLARFINHSHRPNCCAKQFWYQNRPITIIIAEEDIPAGEELTYDYNYHIPSNGKNMKCKCSPTCPHMVGKRAPPAPPKIHDCTFCFKRFISNSKLEEHVRIHTGVKPFICSTCGYESAKKGILTSTFVMYMKASDVLSVG